MARGAPIDRTETPPFLLTLWLSPGGVHQPAGVYRNPLSHAGNQVQVYTWLDSSLKDIVTLLLSAKSLPPSQLSPAHRVSIRHVYWEPDTEVWTTKDIAQLSHKDIVKSSSEARGPALKILDDFGFIAGDYLDIAFIGPQSQGAPNGPANGSMGRQILGAGRRAAGGDSGWNGPRGGRGMDLEPSRSGW